METRETSKLLLEKYLGDRLNQVIRSERARFVLVTSPRQGGGKSLFIDLIRQYLDHKWPDIYVFIAFDQLPNKEPKDYFQHRVIIDGFALNEGQESLNLPQKWQDVIDAAVLLVMGRETTQADIKEAIARLHAMDIRPIGVVFNAFQCPSWSDIWSRIRFWQKRSTKRKMAHKKSVDLEKSEKAMGYLKLEGLVQKKIPNSSKELDKTSS